MDRCSQLTKSIFLESQGAINLTNGHVWTRDSCGEQRHKSKIIRWPGFRSQDRCGGKDFLPVMNNFESHTATPVVQLTWLPSSANTWKIHGFERVGGFFFCESKVLDDELNWLSDRSTYPFEWKQVPSWRGGGMLISYVGDFPHLRGRHQGGFFFVQAAHQTLEHWNRRDGRDEHWARAGHIDIVYDPRHLEKRFFCRKDKPHYQPV